MKVKNLEKCQINYFHIQNVIQALIVLGHRSSSFELTQNACFSHYLGKFWDAAPGPVPTWLKIP